MAEQKCPRCGGAISHFMNFYTYSHEHFELPFRQQECRACSLPCRFWSEWQAMKSDLAQLVEMLNEDFHRNNPNEETPNWVTMARCCAEARHGAAQVIEDIIEGLKQDIDAEDTGS